MITLASLQNELKSRLRPVGTFAAEESLLRLRYGILRGLQTLANLRDWDWLNETVSIVTTAGNLGPYDAPTGFMRLALLKQYSQWGFVDKDLLAPILSTDTAVYLPYFQIQDGKIFFLNDPGDSTLILNHVVEVADDATESGLDASLSVLPAGLKPALICYAQADILEDLPSAEPKIAMYIALGRKHAEDYWHQSTLSQVQRGIAPKGINKASVDNNAASLSLLSNNFERYYSGTP